MSSPFLLSYPLPIELYAFPVQLSHTVAAALLLGMKLVGPSNSNYGGWSDVVWAANQ